MNKKKCLKLTVDGRVCVDARCVWSVEDISVFVKIFFISNFFQIGESMDDSDYLSYKSLSDDDDEEEMFGEEEAEWINDMRQVVTNAVRKSRRDRYGSAGTSCRNLPERSPIRERWDSIFTKRKRRKKKSS